MFTLGTAESKTDKTCSLLKISDGLERVMARRKLQIEQQRHLVRMKHIEEKRQLFLPSVQNPESQAYSSDDEMSCPMEVD
jgi:hypothetical protein